MVVLQNRAPFSVREIVRRPSKQDPKKGPYLENYPYRTLMETLIVTLLDPFKEPQKGPNFRELPMLSDL